VTNNGQFHSEFETALCEFLDVEHVSLFANGTLALICALQTLRITGEAITTPFSFVATTHALYWNRITPIFCDIEANTCNLDAGKIEALITPQTTAIVPVHIYGNPCNVEQIREIADTYGLKVIYDAAHTFGVRHNGVSLASYGDLSVLSFHGTKAFNTFEGGAVVCHDPVTKKRLDYLKNFGFADETTVVAPGINAKMNEFQAALGLLQLQHFSECVNSRRELADRYFKQLHGAEGVQLLLEGLQQTSTFIYFPVLITEEHSKTRDEIYTEMREHNIYCRRYFYPLISDFPCYRLTETTEQDHLPIARRISKSVLCLPIYPGLTFEQVDRVCSFLTA
jgi:dTDP-4-amino-4,6-dideoxygalactose transaminase